MYKFYIIAGTCCGDKPNSRTHKTIKSKDYRTTLLKEIKQLFFKDANRSNLALSSQNVTAHGLQSSGSDTPVELVLLVSVSNWAKSLFNTSVCVSQLRRNVIMRSKIKRDRNFDDGCLLSLRKLGLV